jgi:hypothetical protein
MLRVMLSGNRESDEQEAESVAQDGKEGYQPQSLMLAEEPFEGTLRAPMATSRPTSNVAPHLARHTTLGDT